MKIIKHRYKIGFVVLFILWNPVHASQLFQKEVFSISLPDGWVEMPSDVIDAYEKGIAKLAPNVPAQNYDYGFQLGSADNWFEYPYILVQINNMGRIPEKQIENLEEYSAQESIDKYKSDFDAVMSDVQAGKMYYDKSAKIIWLHIEFSVVNIGPISGLSGIIPTEKGFIQVSGYSLKSDYASYAPVFRAAAISVTPDSELVYKPKWSDRFTPMVSGIDWSKVIVKAVVGAIIGGLIALFAGLLRKENE